MLAVRSCALLAPLALLACSADSDDQSPPRASSGRLYVSADGPVDGDGSSWASAARDLGAVLARASAGGEVWVASGTYRPAPRGGSRDAAFRLGSGVRVYGGFAGGELLLAERDPAAHVTILDGDLAGDDGPEFTNRTDNAYQVVVATDAHGAVLDGFTIRGGYADGPGFGATPDSREQGSGINIYHGAITVRACTLRENWAENHGTVNDHSDGSTFDACTFEDNASAMFGAGLYLHHHAASLATDCTFQRNTAALEGGGAYVRTHHGARFEHCTFEANHAQRGAGLYAAAESAAHIEHCLFAENLASVGGGGHYSDEAFTLLHDCEFTRNEAGTEIDGGGGGGGGSGGGGIWTNGGQIMAIDCTFTENTASFGGGFYAIHEAAALVIGGIFIANTASEAGGLYTLSSPTLVTDSVFVENVASGGSFSVGGGLSNYFSDSIVERCLFERNRADLGGGGLYNEGEDPIVRACSFFANETTAAEGYGGGLLGGFFSRATIEDCAFVGNRANHGGGMFDFAFSDARVVNCTIVDNEALEGGGIFAGNLSRARYSNCIVTSNTPDDIGGFGADFEYGLVTNGHAGAGNIAGTPLFTFPPSPGPDGRFGTDDDFFGELILQPGSPGIDAGLNAAHSMKEPVDLAGAPRFVDDPLAVDAGSGDGPIVDMGARERQP